jgi:hypothetical protein
MFKREKIVYRVGKRTVRDELEMISKEAVVAQWGTQGLPGCSPPAQSEIKKKTQIL